jgi:ribosomal protein S18 acetylase RimI-like enzyme
VEIIDVNESNVDAHGFFCCMSKKRSDGYQRKLRWLKERFREGMRLKLLKPPNRGFIEYTPGEHAWRVVDATGWMFIHCLWVVGGSKKRGFGSALVNECLRDARKSKMRGVAVVTSEGNWLAGRKMYEKHGFERVDEAAPFSLYAKRFKKGPAPKFAHDSKESQRRYGRGLTVLRSDQCPYIDDAVTHAVNAAKKAGVRCRVVDMNSPDDVRRWSPTPFGVFALLLNGRLLSYHYLLEKTLLPLLKKS